MRLFGKRKVSLNAAPPLLQTPRLVLRGFDPSDAVDVLARARGEAAGAMASAPPCQSHEESRRTVEGFIRGGSTWAVVEKRSGHVIGAVALAPDSGRGVEGALALGYTLGEQYRDQGYAVEACAAVLAYAFDELDSPVVSAGHELTNQRSRRVFKKLGFTCEGTARRARMLSGGEYADEIRYSLLREEYRPQPAPK